jgi:predicted RNA-binding protein
MGFIEELKGDLVSLYEKLHGSALADDVARIVQKIEGTVASDVKADLPKLEEDVQTTAGDVKEDVVGLAQDVKADVEGTDTTAPAAEPESGAEGVSEASAS